MFYYWFFWLLGTHHYPVNYTNPYLNKETNEVQMWSFHQIKNIPMFSMKNDLPWDD